MHPSHMHWSEPSPQALQLAALLASCSRVAARKWQCKALVTRQALTPARRAHACAPGKDEGACWGGSCVAGMLASLVAIFLVRLRLFLPLVGRTRPSPTWCSLTVASPCFRFAAPCFRLGLSTDVTSSYANRKIGRADFGAHKSKTRAADCCQRQVCGRPVELVARDPSSPATLTSGSYLSFVSCLAGL